MQYMKGEIVLNLDLDGDSSNSGGVFSGHSGKLMMGILAISLMCWWSIKVGQTLGEWIGPRPWPSSFQSSPGRLFTQYRTTYRFSHLTPSFGGLDLSRLRELSAQEIHLLILKDTPPHLQKRLKSVLPIALRASEHYQVDPFWVLAVMWTESHFDPQAVSHVSAQGLMQIMPETGEYLVPRLARQKSLTDMSIWLDTDAPKLPLQEPLLNIEMGTYYLRHLYKSFNGNFRLATVAYNMGPNGVRRRLRQQLPTGVRNQYLTKVKKAYNDLTVSYRKYIVTQAPPYESTLVFRREYPAQQFIDPRSPYPFDTVLSKQTSATPKMASAFPFTERLESLYQ